MSKKTNFTELTIALAVIVIVIFSLSANQKKESLQAPPFHTGGALFPEPMPVSPPPGPALADNPMTLLSKPKNYSASRVSSFARDGGNLDTIPIPLGGEETTIADIKGPGAITRTWLCFKGTGHDLIIRFYWDESEHPSIEAPIGDFFGVAMGLEATLNSVPIQSRDTGRSWWYRWARSSYWYMPFNKRVRVTLSNLRPDNFFEGTKVPIRHQNRVYYQIDYQVYSQPIKDLMYFHGRFSETDPTERGKPVKLLEVEGNGHYVGMVMGERSRTPGWFGEGDDIITVDGKLSFVGTGTEEYFGDGWGMRVFSSLYFGVPVYEEREKDQYEGREVGHRLSAYRFHILDPIPFRKSFKFEIEHWPWISEWANTGREYYSGLGFWYQKGIHKPWPRLEKIIASEPWDPTKGHWHTESALEAEDLGIITYKSKLEGETRPAPRLFMPNQSGDYFLFFDSGGEGKFSLAVPAEDAGEYTAKIHFLRAPDYGKVRLSVNGNPVGEPVDLYLDMVDMFPRPVWPPREFVFSGVSLKEGMNVFQFSIDDKNHESKGYKVGIDCMILSKE